MNKRIFVQITLGLGLMMTTPILAQAQDSLARVKADGVLKVGTETAFAPFDFIDATGEHAGFNVDAFAEVGKELGVKIKWVELPWDGVLPALEAGQFNMVAGPATITKARMERYRFLSPVAEATVAILRRAKDETIKAPQDNRRQDRRRRQGDGAARPAEDLRRHPAEADRDARISGLQRGLCDLAAGRIAAVANSLPNIAYVAAKQQPAVFAVVKPPFGQKSYFGYIGTKKPDDQPLLDAVQAALVKIKADGRMKKLQEKWFGTAFDTPDVAPEPSF